MATLVSISNSEVAAEYRRWKSLVSNDTAYPCNHNISLDEVLDAHFLVADRFYTLGKGIGGCGPKSID